MSTYFIAKDKEVRINSQTAEIIASHPAHGDLVVSHELRDRYYGSLQGELWEGEHLIPQDAESEEW
jgi:hypothetical protein